MPIMRTNRARWMVGLSVAAVMALTAVVGLREPAQATETSPTLSVVGFSVVNLTQSTETSPPQLQLSFQETETQVRDVIRVLNQAMARVTARLKAVGVPASAISTQGPPNLNNLDGEWQADSTLQITFATMAQLEKVVDETHLSANSAIQNVWISTPSVTMKPTPAALAAAYARAVSNAKKTAATIAASDHRQLGAQLAMSEGAGGTQCGAMECGAGASLGINPPPVGNDQQMVAVTLTYATSN